MGLKKYIKYNESFWKRAYWLWIWWNIIHGSSESIQPMRERLSQWEATTVKTDRLHWMMGDSWYVAVSGHMRNTSERYLCLTKLSVVDVTAGDKERWTSCSPGNTRKRSLPLSCTSFHILSWQTPLNWEQRPMYFLNHECLRVKFCASSCSTAYCMNQC